MFNKIFLDALIEFLYINLKGQSVTKSKIKQLFIIFIIGWQAEIRKVKNVKKNLS
tara:strand:+ start:216 stop:380 length:165 start_codon:yes stop_codon:yes gene_type:complete